MNEKEVGKRLLEWFSQLGWSKAEFARKVGILPQNVNKYFTGEVSILRIQDALETLGCDIDWLKTGKKTATNQWWEKVDPKKLPPIQRTGTLPHDQVSPMMLSPVHAGPPGQVFSEIRGYIPVGKQYHSKSYHVQAIGDSMTGAGIKEGDWLLVDEGREPKNGNIVLARIDDRLTIKRLKINGDCWLLNPENPEYAPIHCSEDVDIIAVVIKIEIMLI